MTIKYAAPGTSSWSGAAVLAADGGSLAAAISGFAPAFSMPPMVVAAYGAAQPVALDLGNANWKISFLVERLHASPDAALAFVQLEPLNYVGNLDLQFTVGAQVTYLRNCVRQEITPEPHSDQSTRIRYTFSYGSYQGT